MNSLENKSFCILPWINVSVDPDGYVKPCCVSTDKFQYNLGLDDLGDIINSPEIVQIREDMLQGKLVHGCSHCYEQEKHGSKSLRQVHNEVWQFIPSIKSKIDNPTATISNQIQYFDLRFGNMCNLQCRSCIPDNSSQLLKEYQELNIPIKISNQINDWYETDIFTKNIKSQLDNIRILYITGGEPTIIEKNFEILEYLISEGRAQDIILQLNTNLTNVKQRFLDLLSKFRFVVLFASIDGTGLVQEYLRYPSKWEQIDRNLRKLVDLKTENMVIKPTPVIQNVNLSNMVELFDYFEEFNRRAGKTIIEIAPIVLTDPEHSDLVYLPLAYKREQWERIKKWIVSSMYQKPELRMIMNQVEEKCNVSIDSDAQLAKFKERTELFDNHRGTFLKDVNLELWNILYK